MVAEPARRYTTHRLTEPWRPDLPELGPVCSGCGSTIGVGAEYVVVRGTNLVLCTACAHPKRPAGLPAKPGALRAVSLGTPERVEPTPIRAPHAMRAGATKPPRPARTPRPPGRPPKPKPALVTAGPIDKTCPICGSTFPVPAGTASVKTRLYCSMACSERSKSPQRVPAGPPAPNERTCRGCGLVFELPERSLANARRAYCTTKCRERQHHLRKVGRDAPILHRVEPSICPTCSRQFKAYSRGPVRGRKRWCSKACQPHTGGKTGPEGSAVLALLSPDQPVTARELADRLGVTNHHVTRLLAQLRRDGSPVVTVIGHTYRYLLRSTTS